MTVCVTTCALVAIIYLIVKRSQKKMPKGETLLEMNLAHNIFVSAPVPEATNVVYDYITLPPVTAAGSITTEPNTAYATTSHQTNTDQTITTDTNVAYSVIPPSTSVV